MSEATSPTRPRMMVNKPVFWTSAVLILAFVAFGALMPSTADTVFGAVQGWITQSVGWFYMLAVAIFLIFVVGLALSSYGAIKLGPDESEADYSYGAWFAMLFSAGMGIGLMFFGVMEPLYHYVVPPIGEGQTAEAARRAMSISFFHWGVHAWAIYAVVGLSLAYFSFRHGLPLTIRSALYPLIGERIYGPIGHAVDIFAVLGTMFGVATSLGLGVLQINAGLGFLVGAPNALWVQLILIVIITLFATASVVAGLDAGIRRISQLNLILAVVLLVFMLLAGPTLFLLNALVQNTGTYLSELANRTFNLFAYEPNDWLGGWTLFYWGWWIAWSPFVGMFIARVSRGRTIRQFVVGVLFVPVGFTFMWLTFFGNTAIAMVEAGTGVELLRAANEWIPELALFSTLEQLPLSGLTATLATILVITFFVTSSDSASLVIDTITAGGREDGPVWQRVFWAFTEGGVAAVLLIAGGLIALQTAAIASALPFTVVMLFIAYGLLQGLRRDHLRQSAIREPSHASLDLPWKQRLGNLLSHPHRDQAVAFLRDTVVPAMTDVAAELKERHLDVSVEQGDGDAQIVVRHEGAQAFLYDVRLRGYEIPRFAFPEMRRTPAQEGDLYYRAEVHLHEGSQNYCLMGYTKEQVIADILAQYERHMHFLHVVRAAAEPAPAAG